MIFYLHIRKFTLHPIDIFIRSRSCSSLVIITSYTKVPNDNTQLVHLMLFIIAFQEMLDGFHSLVLHNTHIIVGIIIFINSVHYTYPQHHIGIIISLHYISLTYA